MGLAREVQGSRAYVEIGARSEGIFTVMRGCLFGGSCMRMEKKMEASTSSRVQGLGFCAGAS